MIGCLTVQIQRLWTMKAQVREEKTNLIYTIVTSNKEDRLSKNLQRLSTLWIPQIPWLSTGITGAIFHSYLSVTHCPLIHQQPLKRKHLLQVFILCLWRLAGHISHITQKQIPSFQRKRIPPFSPRKKWEVDILHNLLSDQM